MPHLTQRLIASTPAPADADVFVWDDEIHGFGVRCRHGHKSYLLQYRVLGGRGSRQRRVTLGPVGTLTLEQARHLAQEYLTYVRHGQDPVAVRDADRQAPTVAQLAERYLAQHAQVKKKPRSVAMDGWNLRLHILPALGTTQVARLERADVARLHHRMRATPVAANRVLALLSKMCALAEQWGLRPQGTNPVHGIERYPEKARERHLSPEELGRLGATLRHAETRRTTHPSALALVRLLLFTGAREGEILGLRWEQIDWTRGTARLQDSKTGAKTIYLSPPALEVLHALRTRTDGPWCLPGKHPSRPLVPPQRVWRRLRHEAGIDDVHLHDLRHTFASVGAREGLSLPMIGALLGHTDSATTQRYAHLVNDPVQEAANQVGHAISAALG